MHNNKIVNYNKECNNILQNIQQTGEAKELLLHACCAPCSTSVLLKLQDFFKITVFYYNPNIDSEDEYFKRIVELKKLIMHMKHDYGKKIELFETPYTPEVFYERSKNKEDAPEGGVRCKGCYDLRIAKTADEAKKNGFDFFCSTLSVSPLKNAKALNSIGKYYQTEQSLWLPSDFKKENGFLKSVQMSKHYELYRQDYCGCSFSKRHNID